MYDLCVERPDSVGARTAPYQPAGASAGTNCPGLEGGNACGSRGSQIPSCLRNERTCTQELSGLCTRVDPSRKIQWSRHGYCHGQIVIRGESGESGERAFSSEIEDNLSRRTYEKPQVVTVDQAV